MDDADYERVAGMLDAGVRPETARIYRSHLGTWWRWCEENGRRPWPASPEDVAAYLSELVEQGVRPRTLRQKIRTVLRRVHILAGRDDPTESPIVLDLLSAAKDVRYERRPRSLLAGDFEQLLAALPDTQRGRRDAALLAVLRDARLTNDELSALIWGDVTRLPDGGGQLGINWTGEELHIEARTIALLEAIRGDEPDTSLIFGVGRRSSKPLSGQLISGILRRAARAAGVYKSSRKVRESGRWPPPSSEPQVQPRGRTAPDYLRDWMAERGWTPDSLAVVLGVSPARIERWQRGSNSPPFHLRRALTVIGIAGEQAGTAYPPREPTATAVAERMRRGGWNDGGLAAALGVSEQTIANWRTGRTTGPRYLMLSIRGAEAGTAPAKRQLLTDAESVAGPISFNEGGRRG